MDIKDNLGNELSVEFLDNLDVIKETIKDKNSEMILPYNRSNLKENEVENFLYIYNSLKSQPKYLVTILELLAEKHISEDYYYVGQVIPLAYVSNIYESKSYSYGEGFVKVPMVLKMEITSKNKLTIYLGSYGLGDCKYYNLYKKVNTVNLVVRRGLDKTLNIGENNLDILMYRYIYKKDIGEEPYEIKNKVIKRIKYRIVNKKESTDTRPLYTEPRNISFRKRFKSHGKNLFSEKYVMLVGQLGSSKELDILEKNGILYKNIREHILYKKESDGVTIINYYGEEYLVNIQKGILLRA